MREKKGGMKDARVGGVWKEEYGRKRKKNKEEWRDDGEGGSFIDRSKVIDGESVKINETN